VKTGPRARARGGSGSVDYAPEYKGHPDDSINCTGRRETPQSIQLRPYLYSHPSGEPC